MVHLIVLMGKLQMREVRTQTLRPESKASHPVSELGFLPRAAQLGHSYTSRCPTPTPGEQGPAAAGQLTTRGLRHRALESAFVSKFTCVVCLKLNQNNLPPKKESPNIFLSDRKYDHRFLLPHNFFNRFNLYRLSLLAVLSETLLESFG